MNSPSSIFGRLLEAEAQPGYQVPTLQSFANGDYLKYGGVTTRPWRQPLIALCPRFGSPEIDSEDRHAVFIVDADGARVLLYNADDEFQEQWELFRVYPKCRQAVSTLLSSGLIDTAALRSAGFMRTI